MSTSNLLTHRNFARIALLLPALACDPSKIDFPDGDCDEEAWYADADGDGYGDAGELEESCEAPEGHVADGSDCDDGDATVHPGAEELCNGLDDDCDRSADEGASGGEVWYTDADGDGYGDPATATTACEAPDGAVATAGDCDDADPAVDLCRWEGAASLADEADAVFIGEARGDMAGMSVAHAGDVNGDGVGDALIASNTTNDGVGGAYLALGPLTGTRDLSAADAVLRQMDAQESFNLLWSVGSAGDVDGDGYADVTTADYMEPDGMLGQGAVWIHQGPLSGEVDLESADITVLGDERWRVVGVDQSVFTDLSGDGETDLVVASVGYSYEDLPGGALVFLGPRTGELAAEDADVRVLGLDADDAVGSGLASGDFDADGQPDLALGASYTEVSGSAKVGALYTFSGPLSADLDVEDATGLVLGTQASAQLGDQLHSVGDADGDGYDDLLAMAPYDGTTYADIGAAYLFSGPIDGTITDDDAAARIGSSRETVLFYGRVSVGDVDLDGYGDFAVAWEGSGGPDSAVRMLYGPLSGQLLVDEETVDAAFEGDREGATWIYDVSLGGDLTGDLWPDMLVGAPATDGGDESEVQAGRAFLVAGGP